MEYNPPVFGRRSLRATLVLAIVVYLTAAGWFFVLAPWSSFWAVRVVPAAPLWLSSCLDHPAFRGALSGFGLVHFAAAWSWLETATRKQ
jgi:hypothetical protein